MRTPEDILKQLPCSLERGLSSDGVLQSRHLFGSNHLTPLPREPLWKRFLAKFDEPIIKILLAAALLSVVVELFHPPYEATRYAVAGIAVGLILSGVALAFVLWRDWVPSLLFLSAVLLIGVGLALGHASYDGLAVMIAVILATGVAFASEFKSEREFEILNEQKESLRAK